MYASLTLIADCTLYVKIQTRDNLFEEMLQEPDEIALKRKRCRELLRAYQQAFKVNSPRTFNGQCLKNFCIICHVSYVLFKLVAFSCCSSLVRGVCYCEWRETNNLNRRHEWPNLKLCDQLKTLPNSF